MNLLKKIQHLFATKLQATSTQKTKDSAGKRLGVKKFHGEEVFPGDILIRQRGIKYKSGKNTSLGKDHTITSLVPGIVHFSQNKYKIHDYIYVNVLEEQFPNRKVKHPLPYMYHPELFPQRALHNYKPPEQNI